MKTFIKTRYDILKGLTNKMEHDFLKKIFKGENSIVTNDSNFKPSLSIYKNLEETRYDGYYTKEFDNKSNRILTIIYLEELLKEKRFEFRKVGNKYKLFFNNYKTKGVDIG
jgi:hypothetical protein